MLKKRINFCNFITFFLMWIGCEKNVFSLMYFRYFFANITPRHSKKNICNNTLDSLMRQSLQAIKHQETKLVDIYSRLDEQNAKHYNVNANSNKSIIPSSDKALHRININSKKCLICRGKRSGNAQMLCGSCVQYKNRNIKKLAEIDSLQCTCALTSAINVTSTSMFIFFEIS